MDADHVPPARPDSRLNPTALAVADLAVLLSRSGGTRISPDLIRQDLAAGAPQNADGTVNLIHYAAWLVHQGPDRVTEGVAEGRPAPRVVNRVTE